MPEPPATAEEERRHRTLERINELDHFHRSRARAFSSGPGLALQLRFLRAAARRLMTPTRARPATRVPRPPAGAMAVTFVGHATAMLTTTETRVLTDPLLDNFLLGLRRAEAARLHPDDAGQTSLILISHAHRDHLHAPSLRRLPKAATVVVPPRCAGLVDALGFARVVVLEPGEELPHRDVVVTAVAARHDGSNALGGLVWRGAGGYLVRVSGSGVSAYFAGDTGYFSGFQDIGANARLRPDVALLPIGGYEPPSLRDGHMSPLDALYAFEDLEAKALVPIAYGSFALGYEPMEEPLRWLMELASGRGVADRIWAIGHGETRVVRAG